MKPLSGPTRNPAAPRFPRRAAPAGGMECVVLGPWRLALGEDPARADAIHPYLKRQADRQRVRQRDEAPLGLQRTPRYSPPTCAPAWCKSSRHRAARCAQHRFTGARQQERAGQVGADDARPLRQAQRGDRLATSIPALHTSASSRPSSAATPATSARRTLRRQHRSQRSDLRTVRRRPSPHRPPPRASRPAPGARRWQADAVRAAGHQGYRSIHENALPCLRRCRGRLRHPRRCCDGHRTAIGATAVVAAIHRDAGGDAIDPAQAALGVAVWLHAPG